MTNQKLPNSDWKVQKIKLCDKAYDHLARIGLDHYKLAFRDDSTLAGIFIAARSEHLLIKLSIYDAIVI